MAKIALVTGGGTGIGRGVAIALAREGYDVVVAGRRPEALEAAAAAARSAGLVLHPVVADVRDPDSVRALFDQVAERFGRIDVLFNNAGATAPAVGIEDVTDDDWRRVVETNLTGAFLCTREAMRLMIRQVPRGGRIINNGSISAHAPRPNSVAYTASKHGITGLTKSTSLEGRRHDIACGQIDIGNAATEMTEGIARGALQPDGSTLPEPRMDVAEVARAVVYMASLPLDANVQFITVMATKMPFIGRG